MLFLRLLNLNHSLPGYLPTVSQLSRHVNAFLHYIQTKYDVWFFWFYLLLNTSSTTRSVGVDYGKTWSQKLSIFFCLRQKKSKTMIVVVVSNGAPTACVLVRCDDRTLFQRWEKNIGFSRYTVCFWSRCKRIIIGTNVNYTV